MGQNCHRLAEDYPCCPPALPPASRTLLLDAHDHALSHFDNEADLLDFLDQMADQMLSSHLHRQPASLACRKQLFSDDKPDSCNTRDQTSLRSKDNHDTTPPLLLEAPPPQDLVFSPARPASPSLPHSLSHTPFSQLTLRSHSRQANSPSPHHWNHFLQSMSRQKFLHSNQHAPTDTPLRAIPELPTMAGVAVEGRAEVSSQNGDKLVGFFAGGKCEGRARWMGREGSVFEGEFRAGVASGWGVLLGLGYRYEGEWRNNKPEGKGSITYADGATYNGDFREGLKHGFGVLSQPGSLYEGQFSGDQFEGKGTLRCDNGEVYEGEWKSGEKEGKGETRWASGDRYVGEFRRGRREGRGVMFYSNGEKYEGEWRNGMK